MQLQGLLAGRAWAEILYIPVVTYGILVPVEAVLLCPSIGSASIILFIHIDEAIAFTHFPGGKRNWVNTAPDGIPDDVHAILVHGLYQLPDMVFEEFYPVFIMDLPVLDGILIAVICR